MRQLIILFTMIMGWASSAFAQAKVENQATDSMDLQGSEDTTYTYEAPLFYISEGITTFDRLRFILGYSGLHRNTPHVGSVEISDSTRLSRFQLILDEYGNVENCTLIKSAQFSKDKNKKVESFLLNNKIFDGPGYLNGKPCKSVVLLTVRYYENDDVHMNRKACYPLILASD